MPTREERAARLGAVTHVLYLIFNEGYTASSGAELHRSDLSNEALRLARLLHRLAPDDCGSSGPPCAHAPDRRAARRRAGAGPQGELDPARPSKIGRRGMAPRSSRARRSSVRRSRAAPSVRTRCRLPSPRCTTRPRATRTPIGRKSSRCTRCSNGCPTTRWWRSITRLLRRWCTGRVAGLEQLGAARKGPARRGPPPPRRRARIAGARGRSRRCDCPLPARGGERPTPSKRTCECTPRD